MRSSTIAALRSTAIRHFPALTPTTARTLSSTPAANATPTTISSVLASAVASSPLKDAVKFIQPDAKATIWTFRELASHVNALTTGMRRLGFGGGDRIVTLLPAHSPESAVLLLCAARLGATIVALPTPSAAEGAVNVAVLADAIDTHGPRMVVVSHELDTTDGGGGGGGGRIIASSNPVLSALAGDAALRDASGLLGLVSVTGRAFRSARFPSVRHMVHTGDRNVRSALTLRSLLVYDTASGVETEGSSTGVTTGSALLAGADGAAAGMTTEAEVLLKAADIAKRLGLSPNHGDALGKVVVRADGSKDAASTAVAALMKQALWLSPPPNNFEDVCKEENAVVL